MYFIIMVENRILAFFLLILFKIQIVHDKILKIIEKQLFC